MRVHVLLYNYVFLSDESLLTWLYENGNKISAMFQLIYMCTEFTQHLVLDGRTSILVKVKV